VVVVFVDNKQQTANSEQQTAGVLGAGFSLKIEWDFLCVPLRLTSRPLRFGFFTAKAAKDFAKGRKDEVLTMKLHQYWVLRYLRDSVKSQPATQTSFWLSAVNCLLFATWNIERK